MVSNLAPINFAGAARRFAERWNETYPAAIPCLRDDLDELLTCFLSH